MFALFSFGSPAAAQVAEVHVIGDREYAPYESCPVYDGSAQGILVEQWRLMGTRSGIKVRYTCDDWQAAQDAVLSGKADALGGMIRSADREKSFRFIKPLAENPPEFFYFDRSKLGEPARLEDLIDRGTPSGIVKGDYAVEWLTHRFGKVQLRAFKNYRAVVEAARDGIIDVFVMEESVASRQLTELGITHRFSRSATPLFKEWLWPAVRVDNEALAEQLTKAFAKLSDDELRSMPYRTAEAARAEEALSTNTAASRALS